MSDQMNDALNQAADKAAGAAQQAADAFKQGADKTADTISDAAGKAADATSAAADSAANATKKSMDELTQTVERLSNEVANSARTAWESEQRKEIQDSVVKGLTSIAAAIEEQVKKLSETEDAKRFTAKMEETTERITEQVKTSKTFQDVADSLVKGFSAAAVSLEKWLGQQEATRRGDVAPAATDARADDDGSQSIVIENRSVAPQPPAAPSDSDDELHAPDSTVHF